MLEREVDHAVRVGSRSAQGVEVVELPQPHLGTRGGKGLGRGVGAGESDDLVPRADELGNDGGTDPARRAGHEYTHGNPPRWAGRPGTRRTRTQSGSECQRPTVNVSD